MAVQTKAFFDKFTFTISYVVYDLDSKDSLVIDPVYNYEPNASSFNTQSIDELSKFIYSNNLNLKYILESHAHADHVSGAEVLKEKFPNAKTGIGERIIEVQSVFKDIYNLEACKTDGSQFDVLLNENDHLDLGSFKVKTLFTPGHTPACCCYLIEDMLFTGDVLFMPDSGTGRCDFPKGSAEDQYESIKFKLYKLPEETRTFTGHDYQPNGRDLEFESTIGEHKKSNVRLKDSTTMNEFVSFRKERDATLSPPRLLLPSLQINIQAGKLPEPESNGTSYLKIPIEN